MPNFHTTIYILDRDGGEHEVPVEVDYDATYDPGRSYGPPENCYPPESEMTINSIVPVTEWPTGITLDMASAKQLEQMEQEVWEHYDTKGVDDRE
mgnify:CR=1 FL=1